MSTLFEIYSEKYLQISQSEIEWLRRVGCLIVNRLAELRKKRGLSQIEFAKQIGSAQTTISNWENGNRDIDSQTIVKLADFFDVTTDYLLGKSDDPNPYAQADDGASDEFDGLEFAFFNDYKELTEDHKETLRNMMKIMKQAKESSESL